MSNYFDHVVLHACAEKLNLLQGTTNRKNNEKEINITTAEQQLRWATVATTEMGRKEGGLL